MPSQTIQLINKSLFTLLITVLVLTDIMAQDVNLNSQAQIDAFSNVITVINGNLEIKTTDPDDPIVDLSNLQNLTMVTDVIAIRFNDNLTSLKGLDNLTVVEDEMFITGNQNLTTLEGLENLTGIGGSFYLMGNTSLSEIEALSNLASVSGELFISGNEKLPNLDGLIGLTTIGGDFHIADNPKLLEVDGLSNLTDLKGVLGFNRNASLLQINGLTGLTSTKGIAIHDNPKLENLIGLDNVVSVDSTVSIIRNESLKTLDGLGSLAYIGGSDYGFSGLSISDNNSLLEMDALSNLTYNGGAVNIILNDELEQIDGLLNLPEIGGNLSINENLKLENLNGLRNMKSIGGGLRVADNDQLTNLAGLDNVASVGNWLTILSNVRLSDCCAIQNLLTTSGAIGGSVEIAGNPSECSSVSEILEVCNISTFGTYPCLGTTDGSIQVQVNSSQSPYTYSWIRLEDGSTGTGSSEVPFFAIENIPTGTYDVTVKNASGSSFTQNQVAVTPIPGSVDVDANFITPVFFPNAFSPNRDGVNDCFGPQFAEGFEITKFQLQVFNRWGALVFSSNNPNDCWDGIFKGQKTNLGIYLWKMEMQTLNCPNVIRESGDVMVIW